MFCLRKRRLWLVQSLYRITQFHGRIFVVKIKESCKCTLEHNWTPTTASSIRWFREVTPQHQWAVLESTPIENNLRSSRFLTGYQTQHTYKMYVIWWCNMTVCQLCGVLNFRFPKVLLSSSTKKCRNISTTTKEYPSTLANTSCTVYSGSWSTSMRMTYQATFKSRSKMLPLRKVAV